MNDGVTARLNRLIEGGAAAWPLVARAQQPVMPVVGILIGGSAESFAPFAPAFRKGLNDGGFPEGSNMPFEFRWANGQVDRLPGLAADLVGLRPTVITTQTLPAALAAKAATGTIPVVFVIGEDPVKVGLVSSFSRPGGNVTGMTNFMNVLEAKRLELVSEAVPKATLLALLVNPNNPNAEVDSRDLQAAADALRRRLQVLRASSEPEIETAFAAIIEQKVDALFVNIDPFLFSRREQLTTLAARHGVPTIYPLRDYVAAGGLISYGASFDNAWRQAGIYAGRILKGAKPADLPVVQPTKYELVINLKAAKALGLEIPPKLLALADEVIE
jgi:putative ABC transport system substrate-binding protein